MDKNEIIRNINSIPDLSKGFICRACLLPLQEEVNQIIFYDEIDKLLMDCTSVDVAKEDGLPIYICYTCVQQLHLVNKFKSTVQSSDKTLKQFLEYRKNTQIEIKNEENYENKEPNFEKDVEDDILSNSDNKEADNCDDDEDYEDEIDDKFCEKLKEKKQNLRKKLYETSEKNINKCDEFKRKEQNSLKKDLEEHNENKKKSSKYVKKKPDQECSECKKKFPTKATLINHLKDHGIVYKNFTCDDCGKKYNSQYDFKVHLRNHTGMRPYICEICNKSFTDPRSFKKHEKIHTGVLLFNNFM
ncbi:unnamed protein product [Brassicogethes aeneus]|uniref:Uncharacterized protein n=1 Tax=Brassicogethes aeneus TaxID=1431903 RepID=A0A9P0B289_BRAAE|nr:unnamed protein product [Brassicogethes aeneus]